MPRTLEPFEKITEHISGSRGAFCKQVGLLMLGSGKSTQAPAAFIRTMSLIGRKPICFSRVPRKVSAWANRKTSSKVNFGLRTRQISERLASPQHPSESLSMVPQSLPGGLSTELDGSIAMATPEAV